VASSVDIGGRAVGAGGPCFVIAEIGINHNGDVELAKQLVDVAVAAGCDAVKLQKRTPELCVPPEQRDLQRDTPWGRMTYLAYREHIEFGEAEYRAIDDHCRAKGIPWFASCWDEPSMEFVEQFEPPCYKVASASITDARLVAATAATGRPTILSTGMSSMDEIRAATALVSADQLLLAHSTSAYPCEPEELNLRMIATLRAEFDCPIGYSGHEVGLQTTVAAAVLGAAFVERHITLDRAMWGSDQAASIEPGGLTRLVRDIRVVEAAMGDGVKRVYDSEIPVRNRLRRS
jgi:N-acetylneuraminate synthase